MIPPDQWDWTSGPVEVGSVNSQLIWDHIWNNYVQPYPNSYYSWEGKPLVVSWAPVVLTPDARDRFTYKKLWPITFTDGRDQTAMDWSWLSPFVDSENYADNIISVDGMVVVNPRFDQYFGWLLGYVADTPIRDDPFLQEELYDTNWKLVYGARAQVKNVMIATWNDYHE